MSLKHGLAALAIWSALSVAAMAAPSLKASFWSMGKPTRSTNGGRPHRL